jgi:rare lipoprotein A (peptidoglycan hydrolase)
MTFVGAVPALAQDTSQGTTASDPAASIAKVGVGKRKLNVRAGRRAIVAGTVLPRAAGRIAYLQIRKGKRWHTIDRDRTGTAGRYRLHDRRRVPMSARARVIVRGSGDRAKRRVGRMNVYREALASWYGPGFYGRRTACGTTFSAGVMGVAHKTLPCGTRLTLRRGTRIARVRVIDRGPFHAGREFDLSPAVKRRLGFGSTGTVDTTV